MSKIARRQHYISRFYLRNFAEPIFSNKLNVFTRKDGRWEERSPKGIGWFSHLFTVFNNAGKRTDEFDQFLKIKVEDPAAPALKKMAQGRCLNKDERSAIALFIALTAARSPDILRTTEHKYIHSITSEKRKEIQDLIELWSKMMGQPSMSFDNFLQQNQLGGIWIWTKSMQERLLNWKWHLLNTTLDKPFVTSDRPVYAEWDRDTNIRLVSFPVASTVALLAINNSQISDGLTDDQNVCTLNRQTMDRATDFVVACQRKFPCCKFLDKWKRCS
ncbi:DUF4238 domain-containing protein [Candidatus Woesearchaeota archaeon]|nr:DUF4238 domain-containing protein [Candidatus Woesearchaeota archaeon]